MMNAQEMIDCMMMGPMGWTMGLFWVLLVGLLLLGLYQVFRAGGASAPSRETPFETLQRRYAEGDLTTEEYEERQQVLSE